MNKNDLLVMREKVLADGNARKLAKMDEVNAIEADVQVQLAGIDSQLTQMASDEEFKVTVKEKVAQKLMTKAEYDTLSPERQIMVVQALFDYYSSDVNVFHALSAAEFMMVMTFKFMEKVTDLSKLSEQELATFNVLKAVVDQHPVPIDNPDTWEILYLGGRLQDTVNRRVSYMQEKFDITGAV